MPSWGGSFSKLLVASYILDWIVIIVALGVGAAFSAITPNERPFSLINTDISYPYVEHETIPLTLLAAIALLVPAVIIPIICLVRVPDAAVSTQPSSSKLRTKLWEWHVGWLGLALSLATAFVFTMGMKNVFGKPRPDLISRCSPDISQLSKFVVGGVGDSFPEGTNLVSSGICQRKDLLKDGFSSFPSGHSSFSFAGLGYLTLFICAKLRIALPMFPLQPYDKRSPRTLQDERQQSVVSGGLSLGRQFTGSSSELNIRSVRHKAAAPPIYLWFIAAIPVAAAVYVSGTRYSDFRHHGFDIMFGSFMGIICAWFSFQWYNMPISHGDGWSWAPRSRGRAFGAAMGSNGYGDYDSWSKTKFGDHGDLESGSAASERRLTDAVRYASDRPVSGPDDIELSNVSGFR